MAEKSKFTKKTSTKTRKFYNEVRRLLSYAREFHKHDKFCEELYNQPLRSEDDKKKSNIQLEFEEYYAGDIDILNEMIETRRELVIYQIKLVNDLCRKYRLRQVKDQEKLIKYLSSKKRQKVWEKIIKRYLKDDKIVSLQAIEVEYQKSLNRKAT